MQSIELLVDIHCSRPGWETQLDNNFNSLIYKSEYQPPVYRIYVGGNLITERTWIWGDQTLIREHLWIDIQYGDEYSIELSPILVIPEQANFNLKNFRLMTRSYEITTEQDYRICFKTYKYKIREQHYENPRLFSRR